MVGGGFAPNQGLIQEAQRQAASDYQTWLETHRQYMPEAYNPDYNWQEAPSRSSNAITDAGREWLSGQDYKGATWNPVTQQPKSAESILWEQTAASMGLNPYPTTQAEVDKISAEFWKNQGVT